MKTENSNDHIVEIDEIDEFDEIVMDAENLNLQILNMEQRLVDFIANWRDFNGCTENDNDSTLDELIELEDKSSEKVTIFDTEIEESLKEKDRIAIYLNHFKDFVNRVSYEVTKYQ